MDALETRDVMSAAPLVAPPHSTVLGRSLSQWTASWLQWALSAPNSTNPLLDATGANANVGQHGKVFFIGGTISFGKPTGLETVTRNITVSTGTRLFFPVLNSIWTNVNVPGGDPPFAGNEANIRADFAKHVAAYTGVFATIDGKAVPDLKSHVEDDPAGGTQVTFPEDNVLSQFGFKPADLGPNATEGIFLMTRPLSKGEHTITFGGTDPLLPTTLNVTYHVTVVPPGHGGRPSPCVEPKPTKHHDGDKRACRSFFAHDGAVIR